MTEFYPGLNGGTKHHLLEVHRDEILAYCEVHGEAATRERYNIAKDLTWRRLLNPNTRQPKTKFGKADRAIARAEITEAGLREVKREVRELKEQYGEFVPLVAEQLTKKFLAPLIGGAIELPAELQEKLKPGPNPLEITNIHRKLEK